MPTSERRVHRGDRHSRNLLQVLARELRSARLAAGVSQRSLGRSVGISGAQVSRIERGTVPNVSVVQLARLFAVLGHRLSARPYPEGPPIRDEAHARLLSRFKAHLPGTLRFRTEVPLSLGHDMRAWDGEITRFVAGARDEGSASDDEARKDDQSSYDDEVHKDEAETIKVEAETALHDLQATDRRVALKMSDDRVDRVILLVAATHRNRRVLREFGALLADRYPLDTRAVMRSLRAGCLPVTSGIVVI